VVHLLVNGVRLKTVPSRLSVAQLRQLLTDGGRPAGPPPLSTGDAGLARRSRWTGWSAPTAWSGWPAGDIRWAATSPAAA
jgi:hypothetical protein